MRVYAFRPVKAQPFQGFSGIVGEQAGQIIQSPPERASKCVGKCFRRWYFSRFCVMLNKNHDRGVSGMAEQEDLLDYETIKAATAGEKWAQEKVIAHYGPMIDELAVDEDMKQHLIMKLLEALPNFPMEQA